MSRPDITGDAQQIKDVILRGGVAILQGDVGYGLLTATPTAARKTIDVKGRAAHKRHGMLGCADFRHEAQILDPVKHDMIDAITIDYDLPLGVIAPVRPGHPVIESIEPQTFRASSVEGTMAMLHNNGALSDELARLSLQEGVAFLGSSANLSGTGVKFRVQDIQPEVIEQADLVVDYGLAKYHHYQRSSTMINFGTMQVVRIGCGYELISDILQRYFGFECPPDPGRNANPFGHLWEPAAI
jgi:tRNA A37 threonylcarbamoyladenosine synthetase subunit TsaC/SUA5/YrdC